MHWFAEEKGEGGDPFGEMDSIESKDGCISQSEWTMAMTFAEIDDSDWSKLPPTMTADDCLSKEEFETLEAMLEAGLGNAFLPSYMRTHTHVHAH